MSDDRCDLLCLDLPTAEELRRRRLDPSLAESAAGKAHALCVCDLAWIVERTQNLVSHHVRTLRAHGIVRSRREGKMVMYALTAEGRALLEAVIHSAVKTEQVRV